MRDDDIFRYFLYWFKGRFFLSLVVDKMLSAPCFQNCQHVSKLQCTKCLWSTKSNNQKYPHAVPRVTLYIYCMIAREIWRFTPLGKIIFPERNMIFLGEYIFIYLPNVRALNCSLYLTTGDNLEYIGFQSFFNSCKALTVVNVYRFLSLSVFWYKKDFKWFF